jgi:CRP-like cAMP-binding protein
LNVRTSLVRNKILAALSPDDFAILEPHLGSISLKSRQTLEAPNEPITHNYFIEHGLASIIATSDQKRLEVGMIGSDGVTGLAVIMGTDRSPHETVMLVPGNGLRIPSGEMRKAVQKSPSIHGALLNFAHALMNQTALSALYNGTANIEQRLIRWLLMAHDRLDGDEIPLTHEFLSKTLGVRRAGITAALNRLEHKGFIRLSRASVEIVDRHGLKYQCG